MCRHKKCVQKLVEAGADISVHDNEGLTAVSIGYTDSKTRIYFIEKCFIICFIHTLIIPIYLCTCLASLAGLQWSDGTSPQHSTEGRICRCGGMTLYVHVLSHVALIFIPVTTLYHKSCKLQPHRSLPPATCLVIMLASCSDSYILALFLSVCIYLKYVYWLYLTMTTNCFYVLVFIIKLLIN